MAVGHTKEHMVVHRAGKVEDCSGLTGDSAGTPDEDISVAEYFLSPPVSCHSGMPY